MSVYKEILLLKRDFGVGVIGTGSFLPNKIETNEELSVPQIYAACEQAQKKPTQ